LSRVTRVLRRFVNWLIGIPAPDALEAHRALAAERDRTKTSAIEAGDRGNITGRRPGGGP